MISLSLNAAVLGILLGLAWTAWRLSASLCRRGKRSRRTLVWLASPIVPVMILLNVDYTAPREFNPDMEALRSPRKRELRARALEAARGMIGMPMLDEANPDGVLCCDVAFRPYDRACSINRRIVEDYYSLDDPERRYPALYDDRRCRIRKNLKFLFDWATRRPRNDPHNPYFTRRINNLVAYLNSRGCFYPAQAVVPRPGMLAFFQRDRDEAPSHVAMISSVTDDRIMAIQTSGTFDGDDDGEPDHRVVEVPLSYITDRTRLIGYGDVPDDDD